MSSRALRRLQGNKDLGLLPDINVSDDDTNEADDDQLSGGEPESKSSKKKKNKKSAKEKCPVNLFDLLTEEIEDDAGEPEDEDASENIQNTTSPEVIAKKKKKKRKKNKAASSTEAENCDLDEPKDEIEASLREVNQQLGAPGVTVSDNRNSASHLSVISSPLLKVEYRHLNPETELRRIFGADVVRAEGQSHQRRRNRPPQRSSRLVQPKDTWHSTGGSGLSMKNLGSNKGFAYEHSLPYQDVQYKYYDAVQSGNPELIFGILRDHPYHIDTLIQMSDFYRVNEDDSTAAECIEKALYGLESSFDVMFNIATGNCHLDYRRQENRGLHICLFKHILNVGRRGCNRTAFELCKLLISLDYSKDPLSAMSLIDFYALRSEQYNFLLRLRDETHTSSAPVIERINFAFSVPLAMFHLASSKDGDTHDADLLLQDRLLLYPVVLKPLLNKCGVQPDKTVEGHPFFQANELNDESREVKRLVSIYVERCHPCWKEPQVISWLERNVKSVVDMANAGTDPRLKEYAATRALRFKGATPALLRHYLLCEIPGIGLPWSARNLNSDNLQTTDPFPPLDATTAYNRQQRRPSSASNRRSQNVLGLLLESLLPTFDPNAPPAIERANDRQQNHEAGGNVEGARAIPQHIQHSVNAIMDAMRQLLTGIQPPDLPGGVHQQHGPDGEEWDNEQDWEEEEQDHNNRR